MTDANNGAVPSAAEAAESTAKTKQQFSDVGKEMVDHSMSAQALQLASQFQNITIDSSDDDEGSDGSLHESSDSDRYPQEVHHLYQMINEGDLWSLKRWYRRYSNGPNGAEPFLIYSLRLCLGEIQALHLAAKHGQLKICKWLIEECKLDVNTPSSECPHLDTPLLQAAAKNHLEVCRYLIQQGANVNCNQESCTPLFAATMEGFYSVATLLIENGAMVNYRRPQIGNSPLHYAVSEDNAEMVKILLKSGADPNIVDKRKLTPLYYAKSKEVCELLLLHGADMNRTISSHHDSPLSTAIISGRTAAVSCLIEHGAYIDKRKNPQLAVCAGNLESLRLLHNAGLDLAGQHDDRSIHLYIALQSNRRNDAALLLFSFGADGSDSSW